MGGIISRVADFLLGDGLINQTVYVHGVPYRYERRLGTGGFGAVYSARAPNGMRVAIKVVNVNGLPGISARNAETFLNEVLHLQRLRLETQHVVHIIDFDFDGAAGEGYIVMELGAENLAVLINRLRPRLMGVGPSLDPMMIRVFWRQMVSIVRTLHMHSIIHMDLKPQNFILFGSTLKIADLGISRKADSLGQARIGSVPFSAPEIMQDIPGVQRFYGPQADIWSLGAILYFMVYGAPTSYHPLAARPPIGQLPCPDPAINDVLRRTLVLNPLLRADINTLIFHPLTRG